MIVVGMIFSLGELLGDHGLSLVLLSVVWIAELFTSICLRTRYSMVNFPRIFRFYFILFEMYYMIFPFGFWYLGLAVLYTFTLHSIILFFVRFEMPALEDGSVSFLTPRHGVMRRPQNQHVHAHPHVSQNANQNGNQNVGVNQNGNQNANQVRHGFRFNLNFNLNPGRQNANQNPNVHPHSDIGNHVMHRQPFPMRDLRAYPGAHVRHVRQNSSPDMSPRESHPAPPSPAMPTSNQIPETSASEH
eukprot:TRINITY_DN9323_c1_g1_i4.p1 TRINITY_DN9323_c1_g1~~TRINITY_DN9323_c1_g1_i4.p1  ORF type:complete len:245 (+),score=50.79 TRINITY_DN9323_c1_g1_i4:134-868(+)